MWIAVIGLLLALIHISRAVFTSPFDGITSTDADVAADGDFAVGRGFGAGATVLTGAALALVDVLLAGRAGKPARTAAHVRPGRYLSLADALPGL
jgi:hypothetical protein